MDSTSEVITKLLNKYKPIILKDYHRYGNHVHRVYSNCILLDKEISNHDKYAIAAVFHDIGIWTHHTFDYLQPSEQLATDYLAEIKKTDWIEEITSMIHWHHKLTSYEGKYQRTVDTFRKADWIDVSLGITTFGLQRGNIQAGRKTYPNLGFHLFLLKETLKRFLKNPLSPLPMLRR